MLKKGKNPITWIWLVFAMQSKGQEQGSALCKGNLWELLVKRTVTFCPTHTYSTPVIKGLGCPKITHCWHASQISRSGWGPFLAWPKGILTSARNEMSRKFCSLPEYKESLQGARSYTPLLLLTLWLQSVCHCLTLSAAIIKDCYKTVYKAKEVPVAPVSKLLDFPSGQWAHSSLLP